MSQHDRQPASSDCPHVAELQSTLRAFAKQRSWERFHTAKNLTTAIAGEAGELAAILQWATPTQSIAPFMERLEDEIADVFIYLIQLCDILDVDLLGATRAKIECNEQRFPVTHRESTDAD
jgi:dCTP diphosphatase